MKIMQFDIWRVNLNPTKGSEKKGIRPCLIVQTNAANNYGQTILIAPLTSKKTEKIYPYETIIKPNKKNNIKQISKVKFDQIRVIDKSRLVKQIGKTDGKLYNKFTQSISVILDIDGLFR